ncbi:Guanylate kinase [Giardia duodenalis]|uniref:Guanylate kinase n=1 Tax=Giardia intestinalis TaxID=5741 RepID=V6TQ99_GIAIN|nr:Guanylate kinase [Giardia intestinalis]
MYSFSGPSGSGKSTIIKAILDRTPDASLSASCTTRQMRSGEIDGQDYYFLSHNQFEQYIKDGSFIEYTRCYGNYYGTLKTEIIKRLDTSKYCIIDLDYVGAKNVIEHQGSDYQATGVLILPPSITSLAKRLQKRMSETDDSLNLRVQQSFNASAITKYELIIINRDINEAISKCISLFE